MFWNKNLTNTEYWFIACFLLIYLLYFIKIIYISFKMKVSARASFLKFLPRLTAFGLLIIALMEPSFGITEGDSNIKASNKVLYFLVDVSKSMDAQDIAPSRLEKTKNEIKKIINYFSNDRFGLVLFASQPLLFTPLTTDKENLKNMVTSINTDLLQNTGTNLPEALAFCLDKVNNTNIRNENTPAIILFTDGEDFADINESILNDFKRKRVKFYVVGMGTKKGTNIVLQNGQLVKDKNNNPVITRLEAEYLSTLASKTNGKYFEYNNIQSPLADIIEGIENLKGVKTQFSVNAANPGNKFHFPLLIAIFIICIDLLFTIRIFNF